MSDTNDREIRMLLKQAMPPLTDELPRDLWPAMLHRLDQGVSVHDVPWFDWALLANCSSRGSPA